MQQGLDLTESAKENKDKRNYSFSKVFGSVLPTEDFMVGQPLEIKDQKNTDFCTAYGTTSLSELQEGVLLSPEFQFAKIKEIQGYWQSWGASIQDAFKSLVQWGSLEAKDSPYKVGQNTRNEIANWDNWEDQWALERKAEKHKKMSYFKVDGPHDIFDNIRSALWLNRTEKRGVGLGCAWRRMWTHADGGVIPNKPQNGSIGHFFILIGQKTIGGRTYLVAQNSIGQAGDHGLYYFPREVVNREFVYGSYTCKDISSKQARKISWTLLQRLRYLIKKKLNYVIQRIAKNL